MIERIEEWRLSRNDEAAIAALLQRAFGEGFDGRSFFKQRPHLRLIHREGGRILGHMGLGLRAVRLGGRLTDIAALGDVATDPEARGRGIASGLMARAIEEAKASPAEFFALFGDEPLYAGVGFREVHNPIRAVAMTDAITGEVTEHPSSNLMVLPLRETKWEDGALLDLLGYEF